jgi:glutathione S-transferase
LRGQGRHRYGIQAPAVSGHPVFERLYRVQMNTLEWAVMTLPCLWMRAAYVSDASPRAWAACGWSGRIAYAVAYAADPARGPGLHGRGAGLRRPGLAAGGGVWQLMEYA